MIQVADRFDGPSGVDSVLLSIPNHISDAMLTMMENMQTINSKVRAHIGTYSTIQLYTVKQTKKKGTINNKKMTIKSPISLIIKAVHSVPKI